LFNLSHYSVGVGGFLGGSRMVNGKPCAKLSKGQRNGSADFTACACDQRCAPVQAKLINDAHTITLGQKTHVFHLEGLEGAMIQILLEKSART
jgi:hypothetical protein